MIYTCKKGIKYILKKPIIKSYTQQRSVAIKNEIQIMLLAGKTLIEIADNLGLSRSQVCRIMKENGIKNQNTRHVRKHLSYEDAIKILKKDYQINQTK